MLTRLEIENYRGFSSYRLEDLTAVNLFVGKNNSGKTAILECVHFLTSAGDPEVLMNAAERRGEIVSSVRDEPMYVDASHLFNGHEIRPGSQFSLSGDNGLPPIKVTVDEMDDDGTGERLFEDSPALRTALAMRIEAGRIGERSRNPVFGISEEGALLIDPRRLTRRFVGEERRSGAPIVFISPDSLLPGTLGGMWNHVLRDKREVEVRKAMQILEPELEDIVFESSDAPPGYFSRHYARRAGVLVSFANEKRRVPLGSMGEGMRRLLALSISLIHAANGCLIIDEVDTGFHYSIMAKMWELVVRTATEANTQVFATTHSSDCIKGLGVLCKQDPDLREQVSAHKIERDLEVSVSFSGEDVLDAVEQDIELR